MVGDNQSEGGDQPISLFKEQEKLVRAVAEANPRTVVVVKTGTAMLMPWADGVPAILEAWYPGEEDGNAVAAVLFGDTNPSGKLPLTFARRRADLPACTPEQYPGVKKDVRYTEGVLVGYRHYDAKGIQPQYPFGHGLSYTAFSYTNLALTRDVLRVRELAQKPVVVSLDLCNTGGRDGQEVVQLYLGMPSTAQVPQPPKQLKAFKKVALLRAQKSRVYLELNARSFFHWSTNTHAWDIAPGTYSVMVGASSRDIRLSGTIQITE
jgi:beta-glucosidase